MKAESLEKQEPVQLHEMNGYDYIQIYANEAEKEYINENVEGQEPSKGYEYDFAELIVPHGSLDIESIKADPGSYLSYKEPAKPTIEDLQDGLNALQEIVLGGM